MNYCHTNEALAVDLNFATELKLAKNIYLYIHYYIMRMGVKVIKCRGMLTAILSSFEQCSIKLALIYLSNND
jgi:hypothetical protein